MFYSLRRLCRATYKFYRGFIPEISGMSQAMDATRRSSERHSLKYNSNYKHRGRGSEGDRGRGYENFKELAFHRKCYSAFTNKTLLNRAEARRKKAEKEITSPLASVDRDSDNSDPIPKKVLRSSLEASTSATRSKKKHVLPPVCILCKKTDLYYTDSVG